MEWKKRGIQLKSLRPDDPGQLMLCEDVVRLSSLGDAPFLEAPEDEPMEEEPALDLPTLIRKELETALELLDDAIAGAAPDATAEPGGQS